MSILSIENTAMSAIEHAAAWLVGHSANGTTSLSELTPKSSLVIDALAIGSEAARAHGVPTPEIEGGAQLVLGAALDLSRIMMHTGGNQPEGGIIENVERPQPVDPQPEPAPEPEHHQTKAEARAEAKAEAAAAKHS